eukprot:CAMPEP_0195306136 /NCGR_PEP_ID=MMETSP0707-20130614/37045_1 /TAXON_ID=33640 /ORGANISM="Asterionellopsis glacialis, Strain CCMP134" /LENGTH=484 /DNA_ID=CAMNT_0040370345 /DNA_START=209 /DNA_END=1663 /DNA_ORIENTATION=-
MKFLLLFDVFSFTSTVLLLLISPVNGDEGLFQNCSLCQNGNPPFDLTATFISTSGSISCQDAYESDPILLEEAECENYQTVGRTICSCDEKLPVPNTNCTLCEDRTKQDLEFPFLLGLPGLSCVQLQIDAQRDDATTCSAYQATVGITCLCDNPIASSTACRICDSINENNDNNTRHQILDPMIRIGDTSSCGHLELEANFPDATCTDYQQKWSDRCCVDPPSLPPSMSPTLPEDLLLDCPLCEGGTPPNDPTAKFTTTTGVQTCQEWYEDGPLLLNGEDCNKYQNIGRTLCSCEEELAPSLNNCTLCEDGFNLPFPTLAGNTIVQNTPRRQTCAEVQVDAQRDNYKNCAAYQATFGKYCQCNNTQQNLEENIFDDGSTGTCRICQENQIFYHLNTTTKVDDGTEVSCGMVEYKSNLVDTPQSCDLFQTLYGGDCCADREIVPPPTDAPTPTRDSLSSSPTSFCMTKNIFASLLSVLAFQMAWL